MNQQQILDQLDFEPRMYCEGYRRGRRGRAYQCLQPATVHVTLYHGGLAGCPEPVDFLYCDGCVHGCVHAITNRISVEILDLQRLGYTVCRSCKQEATDPLQLMKITDLG